VNNHNIAAVDAPNGEVSCLQMECQNWGAYARRGTKGDGRVGGGGNRKRVYRRLSLAGQLQHTVGHGGVAGTDGPSKPPSAPALRW